MEKRIENLEKITKRLARRQGSKAKAVVTPFPISYCEIGDDVKGDIFKFMFPGDGKITKGIIYFGKKIKDGVMVTINLSNAAGNNIKQFVVEEKEIRFSPDLGVLTGNRLTISVEAVNSEEKITECWIAFLWTPDVSSSMIKKCLISDLENVSDLLSE